MKLFTILAVLSVASGAFAAVAKPTCGGTSSSKDTQLLTPTNPPRECVYHIKATSSYVCQLRIDFAWTLGQPSVPSDENDLAYVECVNDYFQVGDLRLCGTETNNHIYVPFNRTAGVTVVDLQIILASRVGYTGLPTPSWDISVTQLECPTGASVRDLDFDMRSDLEFTPEARATIKDGFLVAPPGCLQYFPSKSGVITSFNYNKATGIYPGNMNYAICFRRDTETTSLQLRTYHFQLGSENESKLMSLDNYCYPQVRSSTKSQDYLLVPQAQIENSDIFATYFCGESLDGAIVRSTNPGPLIMVFNSDAVYKKTEAGFYFTYKVL
ncbi:uncharacterized protein LOC119682261 [Teleopsis dalmanni]|uniref:uncharacterized protein LOC119682261 n=1 Tax=Teleopsis dalmanni TaxID=139649 RepID=UPI0018CEC65F|nr:uncharacterized protein LOC119682261 [Teleopsis dalmanni]